MSIGSKTKSLQILSGLLCSLFSYINLLNLLNLQAFRSWLLAPSWFQTSSSWSRPLTNSRPYPIPSAILAMIVIIWSIVSWLVLAFAKVARLAEPLFSMTWSVSFDKSIVGMFGWLVQLVGQSLVCLVNAFNIVLMVILLGGSRRNHSPEQSRIYIGHLPELLALFARSFRPFRPSSIWSSPTGIMLQSNSVGTPAVNPLLQQKITLLLQQKINE